MDFQCIFKFKIFYFYNLLSRKFSLGRKMQDNNIYENHQLIK